LLSRLSVSCRNFRTTDSKRYDLTTVEEQSTTVEAEQRSEHLKFKATRLLSYWKTIIHLILICMSSVVDVALFVCRPPHMDYCTAVCCCMFHVHTIIHFRPTCAQRWRLNL